VDQTPEEVFDAINAVFYVDDSLRSRITTGTGQPNQKEKESEEMSSTKGA
jgi:hypothetical protein